MNRYHKTKQILATADIIVSIRFTRKCKIDHVRNLNMRHRCVTPERGEWVNTRREEWTSRVSRMVLHHIFRIARGNFLSSKESRNPEQKMIRFGL